MSETTTYVASIALLLWIVSPVLIPAIITGVHAIAAWRGISPSTTPHERRRESLRVSATTAPTSTRGPALKSAA